MSSRETLKSAVSRFGRSVLILRDSGNITEKHMIIHAFGYQPEKNPYPIEVSYFVWDSDLVAGDICQDVLTEERKLIASADFLGTNGAKDGIRVNEIKVNDSIILYEITTPVAPADEFGHRTYADTVRLNDYACVFHNVQGDMLAPIGELGKSQLIIIFSARKLRGYVPKEGDRLVLLNGDKYQIDGLDSHIYPGSYKALCTPDQRTE